DGAFRAEIRGPAAALDEPRGRFFRSACDADLGDARCGVDLSAPAYAATATVLAATDARLFAVSGLGGYASAWFERGRARFTSGANAGFASAIKMQRVVEGAMLLRFVRSATLQAVGQDYVRTAAAKGLTRNQALIRHGLPNVGLSVITVLGLQVAGIIVGAVVIEQLFSLPGIGRMLVTDVGNRDLPKVQGELLVLTGFVLVVGFLVDLAHRLIDPRQREAS
ncbi:MAG: ABC transporter permease subunit, partial [Microbacterium sp.]|nr:ABC transporter permease subunit [Microbacterium sp.]